MGSVYQRGKRFWIKYYRDRVAIRESAETDKEQVAKHLLKLREGDVARGVPATAKANRCKIDELFEDVVNDYKMQKWKTVKAVQRRIKMHLRPFFGRMRASNIDTALIRRFIVKRQSERPAKRRTTCVTSAEINRELAILSRAFTLGIETKKVTVKPKIPRLKESKPRQGFFERKQFEEVLRHISDPLKPVLIFAYITGWRITDEVLPLTWAQVDFTAGCVRLDDSKNEEAREFPFTPALRELLEQQQAYRNRVQRKKECIIQHVFHRDGKPIKYFRRSWKTACRKAGVPGRIPHDFRRTAVRNLERAGVPRSAAMKMVGHKTESMYRRYAIVDHAMLVEAAAKLAALHQSDADKNVTGTISGTITPVPDKARVASVAK